MISGTTSSGFHFSISDGLTRDFRFLRAYKNMQSEDAQQQLDGALDLVSVVFSDEKQEAAFLLHLADEHGRADVETVYRELGEIIAAAREDPQAKKS